MNPAGIPLKEPSVSAAAGDTEQLERALIDASTRVPVLIFYTSAMAWLILGTLLAGFVSFSSRRTNLHFAMVFTWCVSLVPMAVRGGPVNAFRRPGAGSIASGCRLVVRE